MYVGQTINPKQRWYSHRSQARKKSGCIKLTNALNKYGHDNFLFEIIHSVNTKEEANQIEIKLIEEWNLIEEGYNITKGGEGVIGFHHSDQFKLKISEIMKNKSYLIGKDHGGIRAPISKLSAQDILEIRSLLTEGIILQKDIAKKYNVAPSAISTIKHGKTYKDY